MTKWLGLFQILFLRLCALLIEEISLPYSPNIMVKRFKTCELGDLLLSQSSSMSLNFIFIHGSLPFPKSSSLVLAVT